MTCWNASNQFLYFYVIMAEHFGTMYPNGSVIVFPLKHAV